MLSFIEKFQNDKHFYNVRTTDNESVGVIETGTGGCWWFYPHFPYSVNIKYEYLAEIYQKITELKNAKV